MLVVTQHGYISRFILSIAMTYIKLCKSIVRWLLTVVISRPQLIAICESFLEKFESWCISEGRAIAVQRLKAVRLHVTRYLSGTPLHEPAFPKLALNHRGLPRQLGQLQSLLYGDIWDKRLLLTLLSVSRGVKYRGKVDTTTISNPPKTSTDWLIPEFLDAVKRLNWRLEKPDDFSSCHLTTKSGPNGQAMMGSIHDAKLITPEMEADLLTLGGQPLIDRINSMRQIPTSLWEQAFGWKNNNSVRKLSQIQAPEGKERVVAIFDYWTQAALKPLHDSIMSFLKKTHGDCTFSQLSPSKYLPSTGPYHSLDLSAATDRFPGTVQRAVLAALTGDEGYANAWLRAMTGLPFDNPWGPPITYGAGQPMGAYSSWAMFALTHHITVHVAAARAGITTRFRDYVILGDDVVIANDDVAREYRTLISQLGVELSEAKTHVSDNTYEFAKRWYQDGIEISGIQLASLDYENLNWSTAAEWLRTSLSRWSLEAHRVETVSIRLLLRSLGLRIRDYQKVVSYLHLPRPGEHHATRLDKINYLAEHLFPNVFGCFYRYELRATYIYQTMAEVKVAKIEQGITTAFASVNKFLGTVANSEWAAELPDKGLLLLLPPVEAIRSAALQAQADFDRLRELYWDSDEEIISSTVLNSLSDPTRIMSGRRIKAVVSTRAGFVNEYKLWTHNIATSKEYILSEEYIAPDDD